MFVLPQFTKIGSSIKGDLISHFSSASTKHYLNVTISKLVECHLTFGHYYLFSGGDPLYPPRWPEDVMLSNIETQIFSFTPSIRRFCAAKYYKCGCASHELFTVSLSSIYDPETEVLAKTAKWTSPGNGRFFSTSPCDNLVVKR